MAESGYVLAQIYQGEHGGNGINKKPPYTDELIAQSACRYLVWFVRNAEVIIKKRPALCKPLFYFLCNFAVSVQFTLEHGPRSRAGCQLNGYILL